MALDSYGAQNQPLFSETGAPQIGTDLSLISNYAAEVGNRKVGTTAQRNALTGADRWTGLAFWDTTLNYEFIWDGSAWAGTPTYISDASGSITMFTNWTLTNSQFVYWGPYISFRAYVTRTAGITGNSTGNIGNAQILTIDDTDKRPVGATVSLATDSVGFMCSFHLDPDGKVYISAMPANVSAVNGDVFSFSGTYLRDVS